ncbi:MAG: peptidase M23 [Gammaproteobacteria bacterium]|nr:peptidase M23 [Gammaproteobacteria bacterium]
MLFKTIESILKNFPKKHLYIILTGIVIVSFVSLFSNLNLVSINYESQKEERIPLEKSVFLSIDELKPESFKTKESLIKRNDTLVSILKKMGVSSDNIIILINSKNSHLLSKIKTGEKISVTTNEENIVFSIDYIKDFRTGVKAELIKDIYKIKSYELDIEKVKVYKTVRIEESLYSEGLKAKIPDSVLMDLVYIYGWDIDFTHDIRPGDSYSLIYEEVLVNGLKKLDGDILIAEFINQGKKHIAIRYELQSGKSEYFSPDGKNVKKAFLRSPVKFSYISDRYNLKRMHPILHKIRAHTGVDYAAQRGSPVRATGDGTVVFSSRKGGYGNLIEIKHSEDYSTRYAHLNKFHSRAKLNRKVKQGQIIGYVGSTGMATGPHLHYEFHVNGKHADPLKVKFPNANPIDSRERSKFLQHSESLVSVLRNYQSLSHLGYNL